MIGGCKKMLVLGLMSMPDLGDVVLAADNEAIEEPDCDSSATVRVRYSATSARLYMESADGYDGGGCVTLGQIFEARGGKAPLYAVDPSTGERFENATGTWLLTESLYVEDGITLNVHGGSSGDADELRLLSDSSTVINLRAHGGSLSFHDTKVVSWDESNNNYDTNIKDGRSYISAVSEFEDGETCLGRAKNTMGTARMDIINSEMAYLGYMESESYGLTWKVRGFCKDKSNPEIFDTVNVYGNIRDSDIHHNYFGVYTYGHQQGDWTDNLMHDNVQYGFDPHDDSDFLNIIGNKVYNNGNHGIIASKRCNDVIIKDNEVYGGGQAGIFLHRSSDDAIVSGNTVYDNADAGLAMLESFGAQVTDNKFENNLYGVRMSVGCGNNLVADNEILESTKYNAFTYVGSDAPDTVEGKEGRPYDNIFTRNVMSGGTETIKLKESDGMVFESNDFTGSDLVVRFDNSTEVVLKGNTGLQDVELKVVNACFSSDSDDEYVPICG